MLQHRGLSDEEFRGERFRDHPKPLRNNSDVLCLTQPQLVTQVHRDYLDAGADHVCVQVQADAGHLPVAEWRELASIIPELRARTAT